MHTRVKENWAKESTGKAGLLGEKERVRSNDQQSSRRRTSISYSLVEQKEYSSCQFPFTPCIEVRQSGH